MIKTIYSDEVIAILNDFWVKEYLKRNHQLRLKIDLKEISDLDLIIKLLKGYEQRVKNFISKRKKKGLPIAYFKNKKKRATP